MPRNNRVRREPSSARRPWSRRPGRQILVVCGTKKTETDYLAGLRKLLNPFALNIHVLEHPRAPDAVVLFARDKCDRQDFDQVWCVVDVDHFEREGGKITEAFLLAEGAAIELAVSNPCFEYWLLLHHDDCAAPFAHCDEVARRLRRAVDTYDKRRLRFAEFQAGIEAAIKRAKQRDPTGRSHMVNPSTGVWRLVEMLMEQKK